MSDEGPPTIDADVRRARTLPAAVYRDPGSFSRQVEEVLARSWLAYPGADVPTEPARVQPWVLLPGALDEPLLWTRDEAGALRLMSNVCTHRGFVLAERPCAAKTLRCGYHGRRFGLDGRMLGAPCFEGALDFPRRSDDLPSVAFTTLGPLHFVALKPSAPADPMLAPLRERLSWLPWDRLQLDASACRDYTISAHWALYCDNYLEGLHIPYVHPGLNRALDFDRYETHLFDRSALQIGIAPDGDEGVFEPPAGHPDHGRRVAGYYWFLFPTTMINAYPWGLSVNVVLPIDVQTTRVLYLVWVWDPARRETGAGAGLDQVEHEDDRAVERVARGVKSRLYVRGRYAPQREQAVHHFHRLLTSMMAGSMNG
jgi:choline monooxygenase